MKTISSYNLLLFFYLAYEFETLFRFDNSNPYCSMLNDVDIRYRFDQIPDKTHYQTAVLETALLRHLQIIALEESLFNWGDRKQLLALRRITINKYFKDRKKCFSSPS